MIFRWILLYLFITEKPGEIILVGNGVKLIHEPHPFLLNGMTTYGCLAGQEFCLKIKLLPQNGEVKYGVDPDKKENADQYDEKGPVHPAENYHKQ